MPAKLIIRLKDSISPNGIFPKDSSFSLHKEILNEEIYLFIYLGVFPGEILMFLRII